MVTYIVQISATVRIGTKDVLIFLKKKYKNSSFTVREVMSKVRKIKVEIRTTDSRNHSWMMKRTIEQVRNIAHQYREDLWKRDAQGKKVKMLLDALEK